MKTLKFTIAPLLILATFWATPAFSQVKGISYTLSPRINYTFWDGDSGLKDGLLFGGHLGFGFGELVELRGTYLTDLGGERDFGDFNSDLDFSGLDTRDVQLTRYGGEVKLNLSRGTLLPFLTLGAGIQETELDGGSKNENIFAAAGLGITLSAADRFTFTLEGKNTAFNSNPIRGLLTDAERDQLGIAVEQSVSDRLSNWSVGAGLSVYIGGRRPGTMSEVDRAYAEAFGGGFRNLRLLVEPSLSKINFDDKLPYRDTWLGGASLGLDFGPLVGFRAFYLQGMEDNNINLNFDKLAVYGADFRFRLSNVTSGFAPFLSLGGGYISVGDDYVGRADDQEVISQAFAAGGGGLALNLGRNFRITGTYKALLTTGTEVENLNSTDQIRTSGQWTVGLNLVLGKRATRPDAVFTSDAEAAVRAQRQRDELAMQAALAEQARKNSQRTKKLRQQYERELTSLRTDLDSAYARNDTLFIDSLQAQLAEAETVVTELQKQEDELAGVVGKAVADSTSLSGQNTDDNAEPTLVQTENAPTSYRRNNPQVRAYADPAAPVQSQSRVVLTPAEFEGLIEEIFEGLNANLPPLPTEYTYATDGGYSVSGFPPIQDTARVNALEREIADLRSTVLTLRQNQEKAMAAQKSDKRELNAKQEALRAEMKSNTESILTEIRAMRKELADKEEMSDRQKRKRNKENE